MTLPWRLIFGTAATLCLASCSTVPRKASTKLNHPVIFVPGMPGTMLKSSGNDEVLWGKFKLGPNQPPDVGDRLAVAMDGERPGDGNGVVPSEVIRRMEVTVLGMRTRWGIYGDFMQRVSAMEPEPERGRFFYVFPYDWRLDCVENARRLHRFMEDVAVKLRRDFPDRYGHGDQVRFDIVAHSMGALLTRYALRYGDVPLEVALQRRAEPWRHASRCHKFIMVNPINGGSLQPFERLMNGYSYGPMLPRWTAGVLGTLPSLYQLLPTQPDALEVAGHPVSAFDADVWEKQRWGLFAPEADADLARLLPGRTPAQRRDLAARHARECLQRGADFHAALAGATPVPEGTEFHLLMGTGKATPARLRFDPEGRRLNVTRREVGDSLVTLTSALSIPGLMVPDGRGGTVKPAWRTVFLGRFDHIVGMRSDSWLRRITALLTDREEEGLDTEPRLARMFFDRSLR